MLSLLHQFVLNQGETHPESPALKFKNQELSYGTLAQHMIQCAAGLKQLDLVKGQRVALYLDKRIETVLGIFASSYLGAVFVPINPILKPEQAAYIMQDCNVRILISNHSRLNALAPYLKDCPDLRHIVSVDKIDESITLPQHQWDDLQHFDSFMPTANIIDEDIASILYTSGSTGKPKGVVLSQRNMVAGAQSVADYLNNSRDDRILAVLPFSFDYGLSQVTTGFLVGAQVVLMNYLLPKDVVKAVAKEKITGLAAVPPLWIQLAGLDWPDTQLRYITNSGGALPTTIIRNLQSKINGGQIYLMYGLTEAFRSTYLPPDQIEQRPESMGKAIPNAEILVVHPDGSPCAPNEPGELVHRGALVAKGYWNDIEKTKQRFKPVPQKVSGLVNDELAVWSGDTVRMDEEGFLYFIGRQDDMIKTSGYRVSPTEIEEVIYSSKLVKEVVALGINHPVLGQAIVLCVVSDGYPDEIKDKILQQCSIHLANYMIPKEIIVEQKLERNANGKIDRKSLKSKYQNLFQENS